MLWLESNVILSYRSNKIINILTKARRKDSKQTLSTHEWKKKKHSWNFYEMEIEEVDFLNCQVPIAGHYNLFWCTAKVLQWNIVPDNTISYWVNNTLAHCSSAKESIGCVWSK